MANGVGIARAFILCRHFFAFTPPNLGEAVTKTLEICRQFT